MYRLAELDADSAGLVRVIDYFDTLVRHGADIASLLRASATLADCVVGIETSGKFGSRDTRRYDPRGQWSPWPQRTRTTAKEIVIGDVVAGRVWIERLGDRVPLDEMLVDRMALTAASILQPRRPLTDAEHSRNLLLPMDEFAVLTACTALRIDPSTCVRVVVTKSGADPRLSVFADATPGRATGVEIDGDSLRLILDPGPSRPISSDGNTARLTYAGISLASKASEAHLVIGTARFARDQASKCTPVVNADDLGALVLLAPGPKVEHVRVKDMTNALGLQTSETGVQLLATLRAYLRCGTLRATADSMHLHHSSVAHRLTKLSDHFGFGVDALENRARATAMIMLLESA